MQGVKRVVVDLQQDAFTITYDESVVGLDQMNASIETLGYLPHVRQSDIPQIQNILPISVPSEIQDLLNDDMPIVVYFGAPWCGACKIMERTTFVDSAVIEGLSVYRFLKIDIDKKPEVAIAYSIFAVPTLIVMDASGEELYRHVDPLSASEALLVLDQFASDPGNSE